MRGVLAALALTLATPSLAAEPFVIRLDYGTTATRIIHDFIRDAAIMARDGTRVIIDGHCYSACTYYTNVPTACATEHGWLYFHAPRWFDPALGHQVSTPGMRSLATARYTNPRVRAWLKANPLGPLYQRVRADKLLPKCDEERSR